MIIVTINPSERHDKETDETFLIFENSLAKIGGILTGRFPIHNIVLVLNLAFQLKRCIPEHAYIHMMT